MSKQEHPMPKHGLEADRYAGKRNMGFQMPSAWSGTLDQAIRLRRVQLGHRITQADFFREAVLAHMDAVIAGTVQPQAAE